MSDVGRFDREALAAMKNFLLEIRNYVDWAVGIMDTTDHPSGAFRREMLRSTASRLQLWQQIVETLSARHQREIESLN